MEKLISGLILVAIVTLVPSVNAQAIDSVVAENQIQVTGQVLPTHYVIIDENGAILKIVSNTDQDVVPQIYLNRVAKATQVPLTDDVYFYYRTFVPEGSSHVGTLYEANLAQPSTVQSVSDQDPASLRWIVN